MINEWKTRTEVPLECLFDVEVIPDESGAATGSLLVDAPDNVASTEPDWNHLAQLLMCSKFGFGLALTQSMFNLPTYPWAIEATAMKLGVSRRFLQMALFRESYSFESALRRCRALNHLLTSGDSPLHFAGKASDRYSLTAAMACGTAR
ncbi:hypothetical protein Q3A80_14870 [Burkholderia sp. SR8]|uniref:hypothetical protein n=1 Tax=Burkholderia sp. SR8 TaxID=3062277 RepID=UPI004062C57C